jgi:magnesium-transporting ATPase (P-type)
MPPDKPEIDPEAINSLLWSQIGDWLHWFWAYAFCIVILAFTFLIAHAIIPSLVSSGHLPRSFMNIRRPMYIGVFIFMGLAMLFLTWTVNNTYLLEKLYNRFWI